MVVDSTLTPSLPATAGIDPDLVPDQVVGEYKVEAKIGQGGFGAVFKAVHPLIGKQVAIKVLSQRFSVDPQMVSRFISEARAVNQIRHHNIIDIFSFGTLEDGRLYYVMEYLDGEPLDRRIARKGRVALGDAIPILRGIARALDAAHAKGIAHRDLKAENIFLATHPDGVYPKLLDFGIAKLMTTSDAGLMHKTRTGAPMGTPHYMSPEQCHGRDVGHRTDMYAFGVLAYLMLTGVYPLDGDDYMAILMRQVHDEPRPPSSHRPELPASVDAAIAWLMRKDPAARPDTLMAAVRMLEQAASSELPAAAPPPDGSADSLSTLPIATADPAPGTAPTLPSPGKRTPPGNRPSPSNPTPPGNRTPEGLPVAAVSELRPAGGAPIATPSESRIPAIPAAESQASEARRWPAPPVLLAGGALLAAVALVAVIFMRSGGQEPVTAPAQAPPEAAASATPQPDAAAAAPPSAPDAAALPARPTDVFVTIEGAPPNTEVRRAGVLLGTAPGRVQFPRSDAESILVLSADGFFPETLPVVPSADLTRTVKLRPRPSGSRPPPPGVSSGRPAAGSGSKPAAGTGAKPAEEPTNDIMPFPPAAAPPPSK